MVTNSKILIMIEGGIRISSFVDKKSSNQILDQFYNCCSGDLKDDCLEFTSYDDQNNKQQILIKTSKILYIQVTNE